MFRILLCIAAFIWAVVKIKGLLVIAAIMFLISGCSPNAYADPIGNLIAEDKVIMIEHSFELEKEFDHLVFSIPDSHCGTKSKETIPYPEEPIVCYTFANDAVECDWIVDTGYRGPLCFSSFLWHADNCQWLYLFDWCES